MRTKSEVQDAHADLLDDVPAEVDFDALTDLFLDEPPTSSAPAEQAAPRRSAENRGPTPTASTAGGPTIEALIMGHLPTLAGAWAAQYARYSSAADRGPVALLRDTSAGRTVEVFPARACRGVDGAESAERALSRLPGGVATVIVRTDEIDEPDLAHAAGGASLTLLTGADDAAIVSAYRTLKRLLGPTVDRERTVSIGVMGVPEATAREAFERLRRAAHAFLGIDLTLRAVCPQMTAEPGALLWRGARAERGYTGLMERLRTLRPAPAGAADVPVEPRVRASEAPRVEMRSSVAPAIQDDWVTQEFFADHGQVELALETVPRPRELLRGVQASELRCPSAPDVDVGVDNAGRMHLVADDRTEAPMEALLAAAEWAAENIETLALAVTAKGLPALRTGQRPELHALTRSPAKARRLLRCGVRVHVVAEVAVDGRTATACVDLN